MISQEIYNLGIHTDDTVYQEWMALNWDLQIAIRSGDKTDIDCAIASLQWFYQDYPIFKRMTVLAKVA